MKVSPADAAPVPIPFVAVAVMVYTPSTRDEETHDHAPAMLVVAVQIAEYRLEVDDRLAVYRHDQPEHAVSRGVLRADVDLKFLCF